MVTALSEVMIVSSAVAPKPARLAERLSPVVSAVMSREVRSTMSRAVSPPAPVTSRTVSDAMSTVVFAASTWMTAPDPETTEPVASSMPIASPVKPWATIAAPSKAIFVVAVVSLSIDVVLAPTAIAPKIRPLDEATVWVLVTAATRASSATRRVKATSTTTSESESTLLIAPPNPAAPSIAEELVAVTVVAVPPVSPAASMARSVRFAATTSIAEPLSVVVACRSAIAWV